MSSGFLVGYCIAKGNCLEMSIGMLFIGLLFIGITYIVNLFKK